MELSGLTKLIVCAMCIISATVLGSMKVVDGQATVGIIMAALGYVFGNGHGILSARKSGNGDRL